MDANGVYSNPRLMHAATSLVGCIVQVQVRNGSFYEGIFKTFSNQLDLVLETTHKIDQDLTPAKGLGPAVSRLLVAYPFEDGFKDKLIFRLKDVVAMNAKNVDLDYAIKDNFIDTAISKYNGQVTERELEPWEGPSELDSIGGLMVEDEDGANGWDANDMFRTNAEKYGVKSSYDNTLQDYTVPLTKKNTEEYRQQEAKALKIAQEIESNMSYQSHIQLENGDDDDDEEEKFSAVVRPDSSNSNRYLPPQRRKSIPKRPLTLPIPLSGPKPYSIHPVSSPNTTSNQASKPPLASLCPSSTSKPPSPPVQPSAPCTVGISAPSMVAVYTAPVPEDIDQRTLNGEESEKTDSTAATSPSVEHVSPIPVMKPILGPVPQPLPPRPDRRRETKGPKHKGRDDEIEEFKKFSSNFKLSEETRESKDEMGDICAMIDAKEEDDLQRKLSDVKMSEKLGGAGDDGNKTPDIVKASTLNPNAKEFVLNPNAKSFTPRSLAVASPHTPIPVQPQRIHSQSPVMAVPHAQVMPGMAQPMFTTMGPQYIVQATPVSMALTSPFAASLQQAPRLRKVPLMQPRHDIAPSMHVAAATGQPILAPNPMSNPPQITMQYTPPPGLIHAPGPSQQAMAYPQMSYVVGPRVMSPQPVGMVSTTHTVSYCDTAHLNAHVFMSAHPGAAALSAATAGHSIQQSAGGQHSNPHTPQSHTPVIHPSPSPVNQPPPPSHMNQSQPSTPTTVMYQNHMNQHNLQSGHLHNHQQMNAHIAHHASYPAGPQPLVLMQQQPVPGGHGHHPGSLAATPLPLHLHPLHGQNPGSHIVTPTQVMPQMTVIPTSAAIVSAPNTMVTSPFAPHPQGPENLKFWRGLYSRVSKNSTLDWA